MIAGTGKRPGQWVPRRRRGQTAFYLAALFVPMILILAGLINTGELADRKIEAQNATDSAAICAGTWAARMLNFISSSNVATTKMYSAISVVDGAEAAASVIWKELFALAAECFAMAAQEAATCAESWGLDVDACEKAVQYTECAITLIEWANKWIGWDNEWQDRQNSSVNPKLKQGLQDLQEAQTLGLRAISAMMVVQTERYYRANIGEGNGPHSGTAAMLGPGDPFSYLRKDGNGEPSTTLSYIYGGKFGSSCLAPTNFSNTGPSTDAKSTSGDVASRSPSSGPSGQWVGMSQYAGFIPGLGPFEVYRAPLTGPQSEAFPEDVTFYHSYCFECGIDDNGSPSLSQIFEAGQYMYFTERWHCEDQSMPYKIYILKGSGDEGNKGSVWNQNLDPVDTHQYNGRQVVGFRYVIVGMRDAPYGVAHAYDGQFKRMQEAPLGGLNSTKGFISLSAVEVYNATQADLFTQDWRCRLVPIDWDTLQHCDQTGMFTNGPLGPAFQQLLAH